MNSIVDSIEVQLFSTLSNASLVGTSTALCVHTFLQVCFSVPNHVAKQFSELSSVLSFFPSVAFESLSNFGITLTVSLTAHSQVHTNFGALAVEVSVQILNHFFVATLSLIHI